MRRVALLLLLATSLVQAGQRPSDPSDPSAFDVSWSTPTPFDGKQYTDGMPTGNGRVVVLAWANTTAGGLDFFVRSPLAMHTDSQLYTLARVSVALSPNPFSAGPYFNQTLHLADGSVTVLAGGTSLADYAAVLSLYVDALSDTIVVTAGSGPGGAPPLSLTLTLASVRPASPFNYTLDFACEGSWSRPDVVVQGALPAPAPPGAVALYHANSLSAGDPSLFAFKLGQQGLSSLAGNFSDPLDGRVFGLGAAGGAGMDGSGTPLLRTAPDTLRSAAPSTAFGVRVAVRVDPRAGGDEQAWLSALASQLGQGVPADPSRAALSAAWWSSFWNRSYVSLPPTTVPPQVGVFPCDGSPGQAMSVDGRTGLVTLPGGLCLQPSSDGSSVTATGCGEGSDGAWVVTPCTAKGCASGESWVRSNTTGRVLGLPGATCPWVDVWTVDDPTGVLKNELWAWNGTDGTVRTLCTTCPAQCLSVRPYPPAPAPGPSLLAAQYARTRFMQAVQSRGVDVPIKFNGQLFTNAVGAHGPVDVDYRQWGPDHWWQNTRLPYWATIAAGDFDVLSVVLDWVAGLLPLAAAKTRTLLPGQAGTFFTETVDAFGLYQGTEYGCDWESRPQGYPRWLEGPGSEGGWTRYDYGGNAPGPETALMALDLYWHTQNVTAAGAYMPIATGALDWYASHYPNRSADGTLLLWPTQVLETFWCEWPGSSNCCENDMPQVAVLTALVRGVLALPPATGLLTADQRARYTALEGILPPLPLQPDGQHYAPAAVTSSGSHNAEVPELYPAFPARLVSVGRAAVDPSVNLTVGRDTWASVPLASSNTGWYYGVLQAALLGLGDEAYAMVEDRASQAPAPGYRFPTFAQHYQDYEPSADHFANMMTGLQLLLLQSGEDGPAGTLVLLPGWPCSFDVSFKLHGPLATTVEVVYANNTLVRLSVDPPDRASAVRWANCVQV